MLNNSNKSKNCYKQSSLNCPSINGLRIPHKQRANTVRLKKVDQFTIQKSFFNFCLNKFILLLSIKVYGVDDKVYFQGQLLLKFIFKMRTRNKKIVLVQSIATLSANRNNAFVDPQEQPISMRIYRNEDEPRGHLAEIFYEAILNQSVSRRSPKRVETFRTPKISTVPTDASQRRPNSGKIVRRSLSKNCSVESTPQKQNPIELKIDPPQLNVSKISSSQRSMVRSRVLSKQNKKQQAGSNRTQTSRIQRRSISSKRQIKYTIKPSIRS